MRIIAKRTLREFWEHYPDAEGPLLAWYRAVGGEAWEAPVDLKTRFPSASIVEGNRVVFNIKGNSYRLVARVNYPKRIVYIRFVGTHSEYDRIDVKEV